jgi:hypothetical protein
VVTRDNVALFAALITATVTSLVAVLTIASGYLAEKRLRRRTLYGEAYKSAMTWVEMVSRVRRRRGSSESDSELIDRFHTLQEDLLFHKGWIGSESVYMQRSFDRLVSDVKSRSASMIRDAWEAGPLEKPASSLADLEFANVEQIAEEFLRDVRHHLSPLQLPKLAVAWRNRLSLTGD